MSCTTHDQDWPLVSRQRIRTAYVDACRQDLDKPLDEIVEALAERFCLSQEAIHEAVFDH
jgi:hypothetical protein